MKKKKITVKRKKALNLDDIPSSDLKMKYFKNKRKQNRIKHTISRTHYLIKFIIIICLLYLFSRIMICHYWYLPSSTFDTYKNKNLVIIGNNITSQDKILGVLRSIPIQHKPIWLLNTTPYEKKLEKLSPVKKAFVRRYWLPARLEVTIEEKIPLFTIAPNPNAPEIAAITFDKNIIEKEYLPIKQQKYKTYKILTYDDYTKWTKQEILSLKTLCQRLEDFSGEKLIYLDIRNKDDVYVQLETIKIRIGELNSTLKSRIERLSSVMSQMDDSLKRGTDYIDIRWESTTYLKKKSKSAPKLKPQVKTDAKPKEKTNQE